MRMAALIPVVLFGVLAACGDAEQEYTDPTGGGPEVPVSGGTPGALTPTGEFSGSAPMATPAESGAVSVVFFGTSLTEGYGLERPEVEAWPFHVGRFAEEVGLDLRIRNAGLSGETSAGALRRLDWVLQQDADVLVLESGANDGLRGLSTSDLESNLSEMVERVQELHPGTHIALVAMEAPPNVGDTYANEFRDVFARVAERHGVALTPFLLDGVAGVPALNQSDGVHPTAEGHRIMAENVWPTLDLIVRSMPGP